MRKSDDKLVLGFPFMKAAYIGIYDEHPSSDFLSALYFAFSCVFDWDGDD